MRRELHLTTAPIDEAALVAARPRDPALGAVLHFTGVVRGTEGAHPIRALDYEAFEAMARHQFGVLFDEIARRWPIASVRLVHRLGPVAAGEPSLWVELTAPHRGEAFAAAQWLIDEMKRVVPIWKHPVA